MGRMLLSLSLVLGLIWLIARVGRGRRSVGRSARLSPGAERARVEVLGRRSLGRHSAIVIVRAAGRTMVVGQTAQQISVLADHSVLAEDRADAGEVTLGAGAARNGEDPMPRLASENGAAAPTAWDAVVDRLRELTVRH
jgi:hypothetical protein